MEQHTICMWIRKTLRKCSEETSIRHTAHRSAFQNTCVVRRKGKGREEKGREEKGGNNDSRVPDRVRDGRILATHLVQWPVTIQVRGRKNVETRTIPIFALVSDEENVETNAARGDARACAHLVGIVLRQRAVVVVLKQLVGLGGVEH